MRKRDPRRLLLRRQPERALVRIVGRPVSTTSADGSVTTKQVADVTLPRSELDRIWSPEYLERLARTYWRFLTRVSLGLLRVLYEEDSRTIVVLRRPFVLLSFHAPEYEVEPNRGSVTWRIRRGLLVARRGRGNGFLRICVERPSAATGSMATIRVSSEVANFYPTIGGWGGITKIGRVIYRVTQLRIHVLVTNAFLRSLARLDLAPSVVGALRTGSVPGSGARSLPVVRFQAGDEPLSRTAFR
jgi:hypothetical protein